MEQIIRRYFENLRKTQYLPPEQLLLHQRELLELLVRHARAHVPFYRDTGRLNVLFRRDDAIDWERWSEIPPLTRGELQGHFERLISEVIPAQHGRTAVAATSGSTGEPVRVLQTEMAARWAWTALRLRDFEWHGIDPTKRLVHLYPYTGADFDITGVRRSAAWRSEFGPLNLPGEKIDVADTRPGVELLDIMASYRPRYLQVLPTTLESLILQDHRHVLADLKLAAVFSFGEHFPSEAKLQSERYLDCKILEHYGSSECNYIAGSCPYCGSFHVHAETVFVEAVDEDGSLVLPGETGRLLVTPLYNHGMPLIRYDHADFVQIAPPARCRIRLPAFDAILGKKRIPFIFADGRMIRPTLPHSALINFLSPQAYQVAQTAPDRCEFRIVPGSKSPSEMRLDEMTKLIRSMWGDGVQIDYRFVEALPRRTARSKIQIFVQEMSAETIAELGRLGRKADERHWA